MQPRAPSPQPLAPLQQAQTLSSVHRVQTAKPRMCLGPKVRPQLPAQEPSKPARKKKTDFDEVNERELKCRRKLIELPAAAAKAATTAPSAPSNPPRPSSSNSLSLLSPPLSPLSRLRPRSPLLPCFPRAATLCSRTGSDSYPDTLRSSAGPAQPQASGGVFSRSQKKKKKQKEAAAVKKFNSKTDKLLAEHAAAAKAESANAPPSKTQTLSQDYRPEYGEGLEDTVD